MTVNRLIYLYRETVSGTQLKGESQDERISRGSLKYLVPHLRLAMSSEQKMDGANYRYCTYVKILIT